MTTRVAVITTASSARLAHLRRQRRFLREAQSDTSTAEVDPESYRRALAG